MKTPLLKNRSFWTAVADAVGAIITTVVALQFSAETQKIILTIYGTLQPVIGIVIIAYTVDDISTRNAQVRLEEARLAAAVNANGELRVNLLGRLGVKEYKEENCCCEHCD